MDEIDTATCPIDCEWGDWSNWCKCSNGMQERHREEKTVAKFGGKRCEGKAMDQRKCIPSENCEWAQWSNFGPCSEDGFRYRYREETQESKLFGMCEKDAAVEAELCQVPCKLSEWSAWTPCSEDGKTYSTRTILKEAINGGMKCDNNVEESIDCQYCKWSEWTHWSACWHGFRTRTKTSTGTACEKEVIIEPSNVDELNTNSLSISRLITLF